MNRIPSGVLGETKKTNKKVSECDELNAVSRERSFSFTLYTHSLACSQATDDSNNNPASITKLQVEMTVTEYNNLFI